MTENIENRVLEHLRAIRAGLADSDVGAGLKPASTQSLPLLDNYEFTLTAGLALV